MSFYAGLLMRDFEYGTVGYGRGFARIESKVVIGRVGIISGKKADPELRMVGSGYSGKNHGVLEEKEWIANHANLREEFCKNRLPVTD
jgi:hypothetical protein